MSHRRCVNVLIHNTLDVERRLFMRKVVHSFIHSFLLSRRKGRKVLNFFSSWFMPRQHRFSPQASKESWRRTLPAPPWKERSIESSALMIENSGEKRSNLDMIVYGLPIDWLDPTQPCQEPPCIQKYLTVMYLIVMHRIFPFDIPARSALPSVRSLVT